MEGVCEIWTMLPIEFSYHQLMFLIFTQFLCQSTWKFYVLEIWDFNKKGHTVVDLQSEQLYHVCESFSHSLPLWASAFPWGGGRGDGGKCMGLDTAQSDTWSLGCLIAVRHRTNYLVLSLEVRVIPLLQGCINLGNLCRVPGIQSLPCSRCPINVSIAMSCLPLIATMVRLF